MHNSSQVFTWQVSLLIFCHVLVVLLWYKHISKFHNTGTRKVQTDSYHPLRSVSGEKKFFSGLTLVKNGEIADLQQDSHDRILDLMFSCVFKCTQGAGFHAFMKFYIRN